MKLILGSCLSLVAVLLIQGIWFHLAISVTDRVCYAVCVLLYGVACFVVGKISNNF